MPDRPDRGGDPELERIAARMDAEVRAEQAAYEAMALQAHWRSRTLADVAEELLVRGDLVELHVGGVQLTGTVSQAGADHLVLAARRGEVDVVLSRCDRLRVLERVRDGGRPPGRGAKTLRARLTEHEVSGATMCLLTTGGEVTGVVAAVAVDHVLLEAARGQLVVPLPAIAAAWPSPQAVV